jgi:hypothetical protein
MRVATIPLDGEVQPFDPQAPGPFADLAGSQLVRLEGGTAVVRTQGGTEDTAYPGWLVFRADGSEDGEAVFLSPELLDGDGVSLLSAAG